MFFIFVNNVDSFITAEQCHFLPSGIIKRVNCFLLSELYFEQQRGCFLLLFSLYKTLRAVVGLFFSDIFLLITPDG